MGSFDRFSGLNFTPIDSYKVKGRKVPGAFADLPNMVDRSWINQVLPELLWIALLRNGYDADETHLFTAAYRNVGAVFINLDIKHPTLSEIAELPAEKLRVVIHTLTSSEHLRISLRPLLLFQDYLPGYDIWKNAINLEPDFVEDAAVLADTVARMMDHQSQESTDCRWFRVFVFVGAGGVKAFKEQLDTILNYPNVLEMRSARPSIRSLELVCDMNSAGTDGASQWCGDFWSIVFESTQCLIPVPDETEVFESAVYDDFLDYHRKKLEGLRRLHEGHLPNIKLNVLIGSSLYALKMLEELKDSPSSSGIIGRSAVRTLAEIAINLTYLTDKDESNLWENFYFHGQGEAKKVFLKAMRGRKKPAFLELSDMWLVANETRYMDFLDINLGDWDDDSVRARAIEIGMKDFYDTYYDWTSNYVHASWAAVRREVYTPCQNPLHKYHLLPSTLASNDYSSVLEEALYLTKFVLSNAYEAYDDLEEHKLLPSGGTTE